MGCSCSSATTVLRGGGPIQVSGSGTPTDPYIVTEQDNGALRFEVRDSATVNMTLFGSGTRADPIVISADTSSASNLRALGDVAPTPVFNQGSVPLWIGSSAGGHFEARTPGTRYTTNATRGNGLYQGEVIKETDTGKRYEWDGSQYVSLDPNIPAAPTLDPSVVQNAGTLDPATDWNTLTTRSGIYRVGTFNSNTNGPNAAYNYGTLVVFVSGSSVTHSYFEQGGSAVMYVRTKYNATDWTAWRRPYTRDEGDALANRTSGLEQGSTVTPTLLNGFGNGNWFNRAVRVGPLVSLVFNLVNNSGGTITQTSNNQGAVLSLPSGFRPFMPNDFAATNEGYGNGVALAMDPDGYLRIRGGTGISNGGRLYGHTTFIAA